MGAPFRIVLHAPDRVAAESAASAAFARVRELNAIMSDYEEDSELSRLSRSSGSGKYVPLSDELWDILKQSQEWSRRTDGAFDVTIGPVVQLWRRARRIKQLPDPAALAEARKLVGHEKLILDSRRKSALLTAPNMRLDLGGIGKGYAVDAAMKALSQHGIRSALVAAVGDIAVSDPPPGKSGWRIEIVSLDVTNAPPAKFISLRNGAVSTSGDLAQRLEIDGKRYSHIVDPRTGIGLTDHSLVTVIARNCSTSDALDTAVSLLGPAKGLRLIRATPGTSGRVIRKPNETIEIFETRNFQKFVIRE